MAESLLNSIWSEIEKTEVIVFFGFSTLISILLYTFLPYFTTIL